MSRNPKNLMDYSFLNKSLAFLEAAKAAASHNTPMKNTSDYQDAIAYSLYHAIELFYKHMIKAQKNSFEHTHDLQKLEQEYLSIYGYNNKHILQHPFNFSSYEPCPLNLNEQQLIEAHIKDFNPKYMDQHLRYPINSNTGGYSFMLDELYLEEIKKKIIGISGISLP